MVKYKVPTCECGGELEYVEGHSIEENYKITKAGKQAKRMNKFGRDYIIRDFCVLRCKVCFDRYDYDLDKKGRFILLDKYE